MFRFTFLALAVSGLLAAQSHPNFSGTWKLNVAESDYSDKRAVVPDRLVLTIQLKNDRLKWHNDWAKGDKKNNFDVDVTIGGSPYQSDSAGIVPVEWKGDALIVSILLKPGGDPQPGQGGTPTP